MLASYALIIVERRRCWKSDTGDLSLVSPGRFWKGDTNWINNCFVLVVSVRFSINRPVRSRLGRGELKYKSFPQVVHSKGSKIIT